MQRLRGHCRYFALRVDGSGCVGSDWYALPGLPQRPLGHSRIPQREEAAREDVHEGRTQTRNEESPFDISWKQSTLC